MKTGKEQLIDWLNLFSVKSGEEFVLASVKKSNIYLDVNKTSFNGQVSKLLSKMLFERMTNQFGVIDTIAGVGLSGYHLASIVSMYYPLAVNVFYIHNDGIEGATDGKSVIILEDVITTGISAITAARLLAKNGFDVKGILAVVDRRNIKEQYLAGEFPFSALVDFEELNI